MNKVDSQQFELYILFDFVKFNEIQSHNFKIMTNTF